MKNTTPLLFDWPHRHRLHFLLIITIAMAGIVHALIFVAFSIAYPRQSGSMPRPAKVYFLPESDPSANDLASLLSSNDPGLFAPRHPGEGVDFSGLPTYMPQYLSTKTALVGLPVHKTEQEKNDHAIFGPVPLVESRKVPVSPSHGDIPSKLCLSPEISSRLSEASSLASFTPAKTPHASSRFLIGISPDGRAEFVFPVGSSESRDADSAIIEKIKGLSFSLSPESGTQWGFMDIKWGAVAEPSPRSGVAP